MGRERSSRITNGFDVCDEKDGVAIFEMGKAIGEQF